MPSRRNHSRVRTSADSVRLPVDGGVAGCVSVRRATGEGFDHESQLTAGD